MSMLTRVSPLDSVVEVGEPAAGPFGDSPWCSLGRLLFILGGCVTAVGFFGSWFRLPTAIEFVLVAGFPDVRNLFRLYVCISGLLLMATGRAAEHRSRWGLVYAALAASSFGSNAILLVG